MNKENLTQAQLKEYLNYDPNTGMFVWVKCAARCITIGDIASSTSADGYGRVKLFGNTYCLHRLAFLYMEGVFPPAIVDHVNRIKTDNRWINLRHSTATKNGKNCNKNSNNKSGVTGIIWHKRGKVWQASIKVNQYTHYLGGYTNIFDAICARKSAEVKFGFTNG